MKILNAIKLASKSRTPGRSGRVKAVISADPLGSMVENCQWRVRHEVAIAFETTGPEIAIPEMEERAKRAVLHEVFGEVERDIRDLQFLLWEEDVYREYDDPINMKVSQIIAKLNGDSK